MKMFAFSSVVVCAIASTAVLAQYPTQHAKDAPKSAAAAKPINAMCPIGKEPIVASAGTVEYKGKAIGFCCPDCKDAFLAWDDAKKDGFVVLAMAGKEPRAAAEHDPEPVGAVQAYVLTTCPVSGEPLGGMGEQVIRVYDGREVRFCCNRCVAPFEKDLEGSFEKLDDQIAADQLRYYPTDRCIISGEPLFEDGEDKAKSFVYEGRLVRLCCNMCKRKFREDPAKYLAKLDEEVAAAQRADYPMTTCIISGGTLGSMGDPAEMVVAGRLFRFCCANCEPKVKADPSVYLEQIDTAWQAKGKYEAPAE